MSLLFFISEKELKISLTFKKMPVQDKLNGHFKRNENFVLSLSHRINDSFFLFHVAAY